MDTDVTVSDVLRKAAERTREPGKWMQGLLWPGAERHDITTVMASDQDLPACASGQLAIATYRLGADPRLADAYLELAEQAKAGSIAVWNDRPERTADDVADLMLATADRLDGIT